MKYYKEHIDEFTFLFNDKENYIILNDGKPIRENFLNEEDIEITLDDKLDSRDICGVDRNSDANNVIAMSKFNVYIKINNDLTLKIIHLNDDESYTTYTIEVADRKKVKVIDIYSRVDRECSMLTEVLVNNRASLDYFAFSRSEKPMHNYFNAYVDTRASLTITNLMANEEKYKLLSNVYIYDKYSKVVSHNVIVNDTKNDQEYTYNVYHLEGFSQSEMYNNAICNSSSFIVLNTDGIIKKDAIETELNQKSKGILLDKESNIIANPILEIDEYDCKASHGAGVGAIDESDLFYLMSRGIERTEAVSLIVNGYIAPVLKQIDDENVIEYVMSIVKEKI